MIVAPQSLPKISLITASFNKGEFIEATIESVLSQNWQNLEYGIIDAGSTDNSLEVIRRYESRLAWFSTGPDRGLYDGLNKGFARTDGEVMGYINADDLLMPWALSVVGEVFSRYPQIEWMTTLHPHSADRLGRVVRASSRLGYSAAEFGAGLYLPDRTRPGAYWIQQESTFWRRSLWEKAGGCFDDSLSAAGDFELWSRFFSHAPLYGIDTPLGAFRRYGEQKSLVAGGTYKAEAEAVLKRSDGRLPSRCASLTALAKRRLLGRRFASLDPIILFDWQAESWRVLS